MSKTAAIQHINAAVGTRVLNDANTIWSTVGRYGNEEGWWLAIPLAKFKADLHIVLQRDSSKLWIHLTINARTILSPAMKFRCKDQAAECFIPCANMRRLIDTLPGGSKHNFGKHLQAEYRY